MAVNRTYSEQDLPGHSKLNLATGGSSGFQAGSTFKPFVLATALKQGIPLDLSIYSPNRYCSDVFPDYGPDGPIEWCPSNAGDSDTGGGTFDLRTGTWNSVNTFYVQLEERTGVEEPAALAEALGVRQFAGGAPTDPLLRGGSFTLGVNEVSPLAMAGAYATFPAHGLFCPPMAVTEVLDTAGNPVDLDQADCRQVLEPDLADTVTNVLTGTVERGTAKRAQIGRPAAGKTGSTNESRAAWFSGFTPELATTVWVGKPQPQPMQRVRINGQYYPQVYGGTLPAAIWRQMMSGALKKVPVSSFTKPSGEVGKGDEQSVPDVRGMTFDEAEQVLREAGFGVRNGGTVAAAPARRGTVAYTSPKAGRRARTGQTVTVFVSNGRERVVVKPPPAPAPKPAPVEPPAEPAAAQPAAAQPAAQPEQTGKGKKGGG